MKELKILMISGFLLMMAYGLINYMEIVQAQSRHQIRYANGQIKEDVLFNNGQVKIFRIFDENGKQIFN